MGCASFRLTSVHSRTFKPSMARGMRAPLWAAHAARTLQVLPHVSPLHRSRHAALLEQGDDLLHERTDLARPEPLPDGEAVAADRLDGRARPSATRWGVPLNGIESRLTLRVAISRRVGIRPDRRTRRADSGGPGSPAFGSRPGAADRARRWTDRSAVASRAPPGRPRPARGHTARRPSAGPPRRCHR